METDSTFIAHEPCPACRALGNDHNGDNLARYSDGHGYCHACGHWEAGEGESESQGQRARSSFNPLPLEYLPLKQRGLDKETCQKFAYGITRYGREQELCHAASYHDARGNLCAQHIRMKDKKFAWIGDASQAVLFGQRIWRGKGKRLIITEGEIDCLTVSMLQDNRWPVVSLPNGAQSAARAIKASLEWIECFEQVVFAFDMDEPGQRAAQECALLLSPGKALIATLPEKDANACLLSGKSKELLSALWDARPFRPDGIVAGAELWEKVLAPPPTGYDIPFQALNTRLHGLRLGELCLFTAGSGIGKSTFVNELAYHLMMEHGLSLGVMALEESVERNLRRYLGIHLNKPIWLAGEQVAETNLRAAFDAVTGEGRWYAYDHFGSSDIDTLLAKLRYLAVGLGCKVIVLDHISIVVSALDESTGETERKTIDRLMTRLRSLIEETGILVLAVVHLKRPDKGKSYNEGRQVSLTDLRGSGALEQLSDIVVALERDQQGEEPDLASIRVLKNRPIGDVGACGFARYDRATGRLLSTEADAFGFENATENQKPESREMF